MSKKIKNKRKNKRKKENKKGHVSFLNILYGCIVESLTKHGYRVWNWMVQLEEYGGRWALQNNINDFID